MVHVLTEIALQLKGTLAFLLGLGGMFTIVKGLLTGLFVLPEINSERSSIKSEMVKLRRWLTICALISLVLFIFAVYTYFSTAMTSIDAEALKKSHGLLTVSQCWATGFVTAVAVGLVLIESCVSVLNYRFDLLSKTQ